MDTTKETLKALRDHLADEGYAELSYTLITLSPEERKGYRKGISFAINAIDHLIRKEDAERSTEKRLQDDEGSESHGKGSGDPA